MIGTASRKDQLESEVEAYLRKEAEKRGGMCVKFLPDFARGFPDRIVLLPSGILVWVETKRPVGGKLSHVQNVQHVLLRRLGQRVVVCYTKEEVDWMFSFLSEIPTGSPDSPDSTSTDCSEQKPKK